VNDEDHALTASLDLVSTSSSKGLASTVLTTGRPDSVNVDGEPPIMPATENTRTTLTFSRVFPPHSLTILRFN
jgi:spore maturation protein SpmB